MNYYGQTLYSVHTREEIREKMMKEVVQLSEFFSLSLSDASVILVHLCWNLDKASDRLVDDKDKFLSELGLVGSNKSSDEVTNTNLVSTPFCSHKFCKDCWRDSLSKTLNKKKKKEDGRLLLISCLSQDCHASVGPDTIEKLGEDVKEMYDIYLLESFMESNKDSIKQCPEYYCDYAIERHDEDPSSEDFGVVCLCGHRFCWSCLLEPHRPVTCHNASHWLNEVLYKSGKLTKQASTLWYASNAALRLSKRDLEATEEKIMDAKCLRELDIKALREAWKLTIQCGLVLKWSCVFGYFITDYHIAKKQYLDYLREIASANLLKHKETLDEVTDGIILGGDITAFRQKLGYRTTITENYFFSFAKTLEDGLPDVKVNAYEDVTTDYWFCDRCTYKNDSFNQVCRMCVLPSESHRHVCFGNSKSSANSHQQVPNAFNNTLAHHGGTNPWEFDDE